MEWKATGVCVGSNAGVTMETGKTGSGGVFVC
jgi:hypothetical protein